MSQLPQPPFESMEALQQARDRALEDAAQWRRRYEVEAQQRRAEAETADRTLRDLRAEISQLCQLGPAMRPALGTTKTPPSSDFEDGHSSNAVERLTLQLAQLSQAHDALKTALAQEQQQHAKTRDNLISALGEALQRGKS